MKGKLDIEFRMFNAGRGVMVSIEVGVITDNLDISFCGDNCLQVSLEVLRMFVILKMPSLALNEL